MSAREVQGLFPVCMWLFSMTLSILPPLTEDDYQPIRALNDLLYCDRRCALHRIENVWVDNAHTVSGTISHERADRPVEWKCSSGREVHGIWLKSDRMRLIGKADVVEFHPVAHASSVYGHRDPEVDVVTCETRASSARKNTFKIPRVAANEIPFPVEYKRGKRKKWDNDDVQLCAQALCLEEMLQVAVPRGAVFHIQTKRRRDVEFTPALRDKTIAAARRLHALIDSGITPPPVLKPQCQGCSLAELCLPRLLERPKSIDAYMCALWNTETG